METKDLQKNLSELVGEQGSVDISFQDESSSVEVVASGVLDYKKFHKVVYDNLLKGLGYGMFNFTEPRDDGSYKASYVPLPNFSADKTMVTVLADGTTESKKKIFKSPGVCE